MIAEIDILQYSHSRDFGGSASKQSAGLFSIVPYHHKLVVQLGEDSFNASSEPLVNPRGLSPDLLVQPVRNFKFDMGEVKQVLLHIGTQISLVPEDKAVVVIPLDIFQIMYVVDISRRHVIRVDDTAYPAECMELVPVIVHSLGSAVTLGRGAFRDAIPHGATPGASHLADLDRFGVYNEDIFSAIYTPGNALADLFRKTGREFAAGVELPSGYKIWNALRRFFQHLEEVVLTVISECFRGDGECYDLQVGESGDSPAADYIAVFIHTISGKSLADVVNSHELCDEVVHMLIGT